MHTSVLCPVLCRPFLLCDIQDSSAVDAAPNLRNQSRFLIVGVRTRSEPCISSVSPFDHDSHFELARESAPNHEKMARRFHDLLAASIKLSSSLFVGPDQD
jgi:hypothetical protein